jgi:hypothetical protein
VYRAPGDLTPDGTALSRRLVEAVATAARAGGPPAVLATALACMAEVEYGSGRWPEAHASAAEALALAESLRPAGAGDRALGYHLSTIALIEAGLGREDACRGHADRVISGPRDGDVAAVVHAEAAQGLLALARAQHPVALDRLDAVAALCGARGSLAFALGRWGADHVEAAAGAGQHDRAVRLLERLGAYAAAVRVPGIDALTLRAAGLVAGEADMDLLFQEALEVDAERPNPVDRARTRLCYAERLEGCGRAAEAVAHRTAALSTFEGIRATVWAARCRPPPA